MLTIKKIILCILNFKVQLRQLLDRSWRRGAKKLSLDHHRCHRLHRCPCRRWRGRFVRHSFALFWFCVIFFPRGFVYYIRHLFSCWRDCRLYSITCIRSISYILAHRESIAANDTRAPHTGWFIFHDEPVWTIRLFLYSFVCRAEILSDFLTVHMFDWCQMPKCKLSHALTSK